MGGSGKGGSGDASPSAMMEAQLAKKLFKETKPGREELLSQGMEALKTGGTSASIPMVQRAIESSKVAGSEALAQITGNLDMAGLGGTPYAESTKANSILNSGLATNQSANAVGQWFMQMLPNFITGNQQTGAGMLGNAASSETSLSAGGAANATSKGASTLGAATKVLVGK